MYVNTIFTMTGVDEELTMINVNTNNSMTTFFIFTHIQ